MTTKGRLGRGGEWADGADTGGVGERLADCCFFEEDFLADDDAFDDEEDCFFDEVFLVEDAFGFLVKKGSTENWERSMI